MKLSAFLLLWSLPLAANSQNTQQQKQHELKWTLEYTDPSSGKIKTVPATVPGAVQLDIATAKNYGIYYYAENWRDYLWMEDQFFYYKTTFKRPDLKKNEGLFFVSLGIDYEFEISLNGKVLLHQEGMFSPVELDLTEQLKTENSLSIKIFPVPKMHDEPADRTQAAQSVKPAVSYLWDWHPRLIPSGIWDDTFLEIKDKRQISDAYVNYLLNEDLDQAVLNLEIEGKNLQGNTLLWKLSDQQGKVVLTETADLDSDQVRLSGKLANLNLWWPHDHGIPYLYTSSIELKNDGKTIQSLSSKIGFRRVRLIMNEGAWSEPQGFPKSRSVAPAQIEINGRKIFAKGTNWVNPEIFPGLLDYERYDQLTDRTLEANFNILRIWGGGIVNKEAFFEQCDEKGIMVWQEFPLACNNYIGTPAYLEVLEQEAISIIKRCRKHPSLAIWSGGNELFNAWSRMTDQSLALRLLNSKCFELDPLTPYINTSPLEGMGHGHYVFRDMDNGEEVYSTMQRAHMTAYTEFGMPAPSSLDILKSIIPEDELWPPQPGKSWESHHAFHAWVGNTWLMQDMIEDYFGKSENLEALITNGQLLQVEGYKAIYEEARRQKPYCAMALNWCFNEPWPTAANNSLINWPNIPKPGFYGVREACRPLMTSARITKLKWKEGEAFAADIWILNDLYEGLEPGSLKVKLVNENDELTILTWDFEAPAKNTNLAGPTARIILPHWNSDRFKLLIEYEGRPELNSEYLLLYQAKWTRKAGTAAMNQ